MESYKDNYLLHYGVKGMKWGQRKSPEYKTNRANAKADLKKAKKQLKAARKMKGGYFGIKGIAKAQKKENAINKASTNLVNKKAAYAAAKKTNAKSAEKAEFKSYRKQMQKSGLAGSAADVYSGGRSTRIYNSLKAKKGKEYADRVQKSVQNHNVAAIAGSAAVLVGAQAASIILRKRL